MKLTAKDWVYANRSKYNIVAVNMVDFGGGSALIYKDVLKKLIAAGVFVSHPSGNLGPSQLVEPALDPADFAVGSVDLAGKMSTFTQRGAELDLLAPGENVTVPYYDVATHQHIYLDSSDGTSWASPAAVAAAALIKQIYSGFTPMQIMKIMQDSGASVYEAAAGSSRDASMRFDRMVGGCNGLKVHCSHDSRVPAEASMSQRSNRALASAATPN